jgi:hypothetical protein
MDDPNKKLTPEEMTLPSRATLPSRPRSAPSTPMPDYAAALSAKNPPLLLQHFFDGAVDLDKELSARFANMPPLSIIRVRQFNGRIRSSVALMSTQDGAASLLVEIDLETRDSTFTFTLSGMLGFRFHLARLSDRDRASWLEGMETQNGEPVFLWNQARWENDYLICTAYRHYTNLFAFSTSHVEAAARLTNEVSRKFIHWVGEYWR